MRKFLIALIALVTLPTGCALPPKAPPPAAPPPAAAAPAGPYVKYEVVSSRIEIRVFRDGPMAQLGHNHVITTNALTGIIESREPRQNSGFILQLPLKSLVVDDPAARSAAGADFAKEVPQKDREDTQHNMLGPQLLDAAHHPVLNLKAESLEGGPTEYRARIRVGIRGEERIIGVPLTVKIDDGKISLHASFKLRHADLGLTPFTAALGALRVRDEFEIDCRLEARRGYKT